SRPAGTAIAKLLSVAGNSPDSSMPPDDRRNTSVNPGNPRTAMAIRGSVRKIVKHISRNEPDNRLIQLLPLRLSVGVRARSGESVGLMPLRRANHQSAPQISS